MKPQLTRLLIPRFLNSLYCFLRYGALVSPRAEVEVSRNLKLGKRARISSFVKIKTFSGPLSIGEEVAIATGCFISADRGGISIGRDTQIGPNCTIVSSSFRFDKLDTPIRDQPKGSLGVHIGPNVVLGAGVVILDGTHLGQGVVVAPNSVVSGRFEDNVVIDGSPAKVIFVRR